MNAWERSSEAAFTELNQQLSAGALPSFPSERAFDKDRCPSDQNIQQSF